VSLVFAMFPENITKFFSEQELKTNEAANNRIIFFIILKFII
jgi:hypothetical protein